jgi:hypothetical protein
MRRLLIPVMLVAGLLAASPARAATITFESARVNPNESFVVSVILDDVADLIAFNFDFGFDPAVVGTPTVTRGDIFAGIGEPCDLCFFPGFAPTDPVSGVPGVVSLISDVILGQVPGITGGGTLAVLTFQALAGGGDAGLAISNVLLSDSQFNPIDGTIIRNGMVTVVPAAVPEPSTLGLLGLGLLALARRRRPKTPAAR